MKKLALVLLTALLSAGSAHAGLKAVSNASGVPAGTDLSSSNATATGGTAAQTLAAHFGTLPSIKDFAGVTCDGSTDDTTGLQNFLNLGVAATFPTNATCRAHDLVWKTGSRLYGLGNWSGVTSNDEATGTSIIKYNGAGGANSAVVIMSAAAVGTTTATYLQNIALTNVVIDGNNLAQYGVYMVRAWSNNQLDFITVTNTLLHGFWAGMCWNGSPRNWVAYQNSGAGITLGINTFSWASAAVDQSTLTSFFAYYNGYHSAAYLNAFNETTGVALEYGIGVGNNRGLTFVNAQSQNNGGAGLYMNSNLNGPTNFVGGYFEGNGQSSGATAQWWLWDASATASWNIVFNGVRLGLTPAARLTGSAPSRTETGTEFRNMPFLGTINADWTTYRIFDSDRNVVFSASSPAAVYTIQGGLSLTVPLPDTSGGTGLSGLGTGVATWLGTPSSANLLAAITDETGTGAAMFGTSPTISGHATIEGVTATGATGSGNFVFSASPTLSGTVNVSGLVGTGSIRGNVSQSSKTSNYSVQATDRGIHFNNTAAAGEVDFTLPTAAVGLNYCFVVTAAQIVKVIAAAGEKIAIGTTNSAATGNVTASAVYSEVCIEGIASQWVAWSSQGSWTVN